MHELLTASQMAWADRQAIAGGTPGTILMENAGAAVAGAALGLVKPRALITVLAGTGNNGGDGFIAARLLVARGHQVTVALFGDAARISGDARYALDLWDGPVVPAGDADFGSCDLVIDALFGAGLTRALDQQSAALVIAANQCSAPVLSVDLPSGLDADTGLIGGPVIQATETVTFFRLKPAHVLMPGRRLCGQVGLADIGIDKDVLKTVRPIAFVNQPQLWCEKLPRAAPHGHKYHRGHTVVVSGGKAKTGAARLAAGAALRSGSGLVTVASPADAIPENAAHLTAIMLRQIEDGDGLAAILDESRFNTVVLGPGLGVGNAAKTMTETVLAAGLAVVLDADCLTSFADDPEQLFKAIAAGDGQVVLTPHAGEFARLFSNFDPAKIGKLAAAQQAAVCSGAVMVFKGPDTVIAAPNGQAAINDRAPPTLATAGTGDVLAGIIAGLLAQGMPAFEAACCGVWLHSRAACHAGAGMIAEDLLPGLRHAIGELAPTGATTTPAQIAKAAGARIFGGDGGLVEANGMVYRLPPPGL